MRSSMRTIALTTLVAFAALSQTLHAQPGHPSTKVNVPFAFDYGAQHFPAGVYIISMRDQNVLLLQGGDRSAWVMIESGYDPTQHKAGSVTFHKYGANYFLAEFSPAWGSIHATVFESRAERRAARDYAANHLTPSLVQLALLRDDGSASRSK